MKKPLLFFVLSLFVQLSFSQSSYFTITGKIMDAETKLPLQSASVFTQNTTIGTTTDAAGNFSLHLPNGGYDLVVTFTGYETASKRITTSDNNDKVLEISLKQKEKSLEAIAVVASNEVKDGLEKYGDFFVENFIGKTLFSKDCSIKNKEVLKFYYSKRKNRLKVLASAPIEIENRALGYNIKYTLDSFTHEYGTLISTYSGYPLFEQMNSSDPVMQSVWQKNRARAYKGSILHFMRSVYSKKLKEEGFEIQFVVKENENENPVVLKDFYGALNYKKNDSTNTVDIYPNQLNLAVLYKNAQPEESYISSTNEENKKFQLSVVKFLQDQPITIEQNGYYYNQDDITLTGYWMWEKTADMLPYDYVPDTN